MFQFNTSTCHNSPSLNPSDTFCWRAVPQYHMINCNENWNHISAPCRYQLTEIAWLLIRLRVAFLAWSIVQRTTYFISTNQIQRCVYLSTICYEIGAIFKDPEWFFFNSEKIISHNADYEFWVYLWHNFKMRYVTF